MPAAPAATAHPQTASGEFIGLTISDARRALAESFRVAEIDTPDLDARILVGHALRLEPAALIVQAERKLDPHETDELAALARRRIAREPLARIVGSKEFWGLGLRLSAATLVPRPETETVVEAALAALDVGGARTRPLRIADLGTGSGAILLALLSELPNAFGVGTDISLAALATARDNSRQHGMATRSAFVACDFGAPLAGAFDLVVSNPPYVETGDLTGLMPEVRHDPVCALDGGADGLSAYRALIKDATRLIVPSGYLVLELGFGQAESVAKLLHRAGLAAAPTRIDLGGVPRAITACVATMTR